jgi:hypothetical protein
VKLTLSLLERRFYQAPTRGKAVVNKMNVDKNVIGVLAIVMSVVVISAVCTANPRSTKQC